MLTINKKVIAIFMVLVFLFGGVAYGQTNDLPDPGMLPDSPFYFLKSLSENIGTIFTFGDNAKAERFLNLSEKRLSEAKALADKGNTEMAERAIERYQEQVENALSRAERARERGEDTDDVLTRVSEATLRHQETLADVYEKVPEEAKPAIERAMERAMRGHEEAMRAISDEKREEESENMENKRQETGQRLENLREEGVPVPEVPTREDIEERIPVTPEDGMPEVPADPQMPEQDNGAETEGPGGTPDLLETQEREEIMPVPETGNEIPENEGRPQAPGRP